MTLKTDFFTVAQSGPTVDGREIKMQWLKDAAETYSHGKHISKIWPEHYRYMGLGEIADVRFKEEDGIGYLENRISPHNDLIYFVRQNRMTQPSIEMAFSRTDPEKEVIILLAFLLGKEAM